MLWEPPEKSATTGQRVFYDIECHKCPSGKDSEFCEEPCGKSVVFKPSGNNLIYTNVTIRGLTQDTEYKFVIYSKNNNSERISKTKWEKFVKKVKTAGMLKPFFAAFGSMSAPAASCSIQNFLFIAHLAHASICKQNTHKGQLT